jgi:hypothetical protein
MNTKIFQSMLAAALIVWVSSCAILQRETPEKKARKFVLAFQKSLSQPDAEVLKFFGPDQSRESLMAAIDILQNTDSALLSCIADFDKMSIVLVPVGEEIMGYSYGAFQTLGKVETEGQYVRITIPASLLPIGNEAGTQQTSLTMMLKDVDGQYIIYQLEGDGFYNAFTSMKHDIQYASHREAEIKEREAIYELARGLEEKFDSVVWYAQYNGKVYFYAITGQWNEEALYPQNGMERPDFKMGLVDETGKEIVPIAFEMIGTLGADQENAVEVKSSYGYGYLSLDGDTLVPPEYEQIIPYPQAGVWIVQAEGRYGFVDDRGKFTEGFINANAKQYVEDFAFLPSQGTINSENYALCESPRQEGAGTGHFISPSYWVAAQLFEPIQFGFTTTAIDAPVGGWTEYVEFGTFFKTISDGIGVVVASFKERYLEGREEFYEHDNLLFTDADHQIVSKENINGENIEVKKISDAVLEVSMTNTPLYFEMTGMDGQLQSPRSYKYYQIDGSRVTALESNRFHPETEFVKLDDSYITGDFKIFNEASGQWDVTGSLPATTLEYMRNEILAGYGMTFQNEETRGYFENQKWYTARYQNEADFEAELTEIDRHNLLFLAKSLSDRVEPM